MVGGTGQIDVVGEPLAYGVGFIALLLVGFSRVTGQYFTTLAHEGGHAFTAALLFRQITGLKIFDNTGGVTTVLTRPYRLGNLLIAFAGYAFPSLLGLAGAALIANGQIVSVLLATIFLAVLALLVARNGLAVLIPLLVVLGVGYVFLQGSAQLQAATAVGIAWFLLIAGLVDAVTLPSDRGDAANLARKTLVPGFVWQLIWITIAVVALYVGGRLLLVPGS